MKFIFLDIDGVANSSRSVFVKLGPTPETSELVRELAAQELPDETELEYGVAFGLKTVDPVCVALINKLIDDETGIVLSSTHRKFLWNSKIPYGSSEHLKRLRLYLRAMGFALSDTTYLSVTPVLHKQRGNEIDGWLNHAWECGIYDDDDPYVILDDSADMLPGQPLVLVDATHGFSFENYSEACRHLGVDAPGMILL